MHFTRGRDASALELLDVNTRENTRIYYNIIIIQSRAFRAQQITFFFDLQKYITG